MSEIKPIAILINDEKAKQASEFLAEQLSLPIIGTEQSSSFSFLLFFDQGMLKLIQSNMDKMGAVWVDFGKGKSAYRQKHQGKGKLPVSRACGIKQNHRPSIIDGTAGLGQDAFVLAGLGCQLLCIEQQPVIAALLADGLLRAKESGNLQLQEIVAKMQLVEGESETILKDNRADVVYLDPMYPHQENRKQAKVKKGMQLFRSLSGTLSNEPELLAAALTAATDRVVVKRPDWASPIAGKEPTYQVPAKNHRFDIYKTSL
ncbi:MAG: rRNA methyltransferase [Gammaproteobacteria bacterium]|nr:MAG: rRNA methyltransferase [Gammaproteobacteria bacterium]